MLDVNEQIRLFQEFLEMHYLAELLERVRKGEEFLQIDFGILAKFSPELADLILEQPEETLKAGEISLTNFDLPKEVKKFHLRLTNVAEKEKILIRNIRSRHLGKLLVIEGVVRQKSDVRPQVTSAKFECPSCGNVISVLQVDTKFKEPSRCGCGRKGKFRLLSKELIDAQGIVLEESSKDLEGGEQPKRVNILLKNDLVSPLSEKKTNPGTSIRVIGILKEVPIIFKSGGQSTKFDLMIEANNVEALEEDYTSIEIDEEEIKEILELGKDPKIFQKLSQSLAPGIYGHDKVKEALILQFMGGVRKKRDDGVMTRGDIHMLLIGDPGSGKSQMLKRAAIVAPKARYVSGKGSSGAGLTASVVRDEFLSGWSLEAGALVLANRGILMIDELDKMNPEDRSAMHEGLEQQSFHYDTQLQCSDGSEIKIGEYVEKLMQQSPHKLLMGRDCYVLKLDAFDKKLLTTDGKTIYETSIDRISKHKAPKTFVGITLGNGRKVIVTPEHPVFCVNHSRIITKEAKDVTTGDWIPVPLHLPLAGEEQFFSLSHAEVYNERALQHIKIPVHNDLHFFKIIGYLLAEGSHEINRCKIIGINFTNNNKMLIDDFQRCMKAFFNLEAYIQQTKKPGESWYCARYISTELVTFIQGSVPEVLELAPQKCIPEVCMKGTKEHIAAMLSCMFEGDGHAAKKVRTIRVGYATTSRRMAEQAQDLLLRFKIRTNLTEHKGCYKVAITGYENLLRFYQSIRFVSREKNAIVEDYLLKSPAKVIRTVKDVVPCCGEELVALLKKYNVSTVGKNILATMKHDYLTKKKNISRRHLQKAVLLLEQKQVLGADLEHLRMLKNFAFGELGFERVRDVKVIPNTDQEWTYDLTIEPTHAFISQNMMLHNTISISKANIQATLRCETTVLAAANPKFGRFDPYETIAKQIDLPPALINRFDLIFAIKDIPDAEKDEQIAHFILTLHKKQGTQTPPIETQLLRKYLIYGRQKVHPVLTQDAFEELKSYYVKMRTSGMTEEKIVKAIPLSARQLEALVRLSEAAARARLSQTVERKDAKRAISLLQYCLEQVGLDPETGKIDIDRISTGISTSERTKMIGVRELIHELEEKLGKIIPLEEVVKAAQEKGISEEKVVETIEKLKRSGDLFEPKRGHISRI